MALLDGKQLRNQSTELGKLSGSGIVSFTAATMSFTSGSVLTTATANIVNPTDVVNKEYVDSVAAGLDPKQSVAYTTTGNITLSGLDAKLNGDWTQELSGGERILVKDQTDKTENGIYVASDTAAWSRAEDHDGTPANEVTLGNFTFVEYGTLAGSGFVLHSTDSTNTPIITPGSDEQEWTLYSQAGAYTAGTGLNLNDGEFEIDVTGVAAGSYGSADSTTTFTVNNEGQLTAASDTQISIVASQVTDFDAAAETAIFEDPNFVDGTTIEFDVTAGDSVTAEVSDSSLTSAKLDTGSNGGATAGYVLSVDGTGDFKWILDEGDISSVEAGNGLIGGGAEGDVTLNLGGTTLDDVTFDFGASASINFGNAGPGQYADSIGAGAKSYFFMQYKDNGMPSGSLGILQNATSIFSDFVDGTTTIGGSTVSLTGANTTIGGNTLSVGVVDINIGDTNTTDLKLNGDYIWASASNLQLDAGDSNGPSSSTIQLNNDNIGIHATGFTDFTSAVGLNISTSGNANINGNTFSVGATNFDFQGSHFQQSVSDSYTASIGGSYSVEATESITLKTQGDFKLNGDYISASGSAFDVTTDLVSIDSGTGPSQFLSGTDTTISASASLNLTADEGNISIGDGKGLQYVSDYSSTFVDNSLVTKKYVDSLDAAQITGVSAGNGLFGGGTAGDVTLNLGGTVSENIEFDFGGSASLYLGSQGPNRQMVDFNAQTENLFFYTVDNNFMGTNMSGPPMGSLRMSKDNGVHTTTLNNSPVDGKVSVFAYTASLSGSEIIIETPSYQNNGDIKITSTNVLGLSGPSMSITSDSMIITSASMSIQSEAYTLGQTGASFSYKEYDNNTGRNLGTDFVLGASSSKLTVSTYDYSMLQEVENGLVIGSTGSSLSFDKTAITLGSVSSFKQNGYVQSANGLVNSGLTIGASASTLSHSFQDNSNGNYSESSLTLGVSGSSFVAGSMSIQSDSYSLGQTGASFSYKEYDSNTGNTTGTDFTINGSQSSLSYSTYVMGTGYVNADLLIGASASTLSYSGGFGSDNVLSLGASGASFVAASMSIQSDSYSFGPSGGSFSYETTISSPMGGYNGKNEFEIGLTSSKLTNSVYDQKIAGVTDAGLVIGSSSTLLSHARTSLELGTASTKLSRNDYDNSTGMWKEVGSLTISASGSSFVSASMSIQSDKYSLGQTGASFSYKEYDSNTGNTTGADFTINGSQSSLSYSTFDMYSGYVNADLLIGASASTLSYNDDKLTLGSSGSSFVAASMSIQSDKFGLSQSGASFSFGGGNSTKSTDFVLGTHSTSLYSSTSLSLTTDSSVYNGAMMTYGKHGLEIGTVSTLSGGTASIVLGGTGASGPISITGLASYTEDYSAQFGTHSLVTKAYVDSLDAAQITGVSAGAGLAGGGTAGTVDLSVNTDNGLSIDGDNVVLGGTLSQSTTIAGGNQELFLGLTSSLITFLHVDAIQSQERYTATGAGVLTIDKNPGGRVDVMDNTSVGGGVSKFELHGSDSRLETVTDNGNSLSQLVLSDAYAQFMVNDNGTQSGFIFQPKNGGTADYMFVDGRSGTASVGLEYFDDYSANFTDNSLVTKKYADTKVSGVTAGAGLSGGGVDGDITLNADITIDGGLTFSSTGDAGTIEVVVDNSTIQVVNGALAVVAGTSQPVYQSATCSVANGDTGIALTSTPNDYSRIEVYVNGQLQNLTENTTGDCYFGAAGTVLTSLTSGDSLHWDSANAGFELSATDVIKVHYQA